MRLPLAVAGPHLPTETLGSTDLEACALEDDREAAIVPGAEDYADYGTRIY